MLSLDHLPFYETGESKELNMMRPFGPAIGNITLPPIIMDDFNADVESKTKKIDWSHNLVGQVKEEFLISNEVLIKHSQFFSKIALNYVKDYSGRHCKPANKNIRPVVHINSAW